jgi:nicotinic acid mononucleotide adenylyltransferase
LDVEQLKGSICEVIKMTDPGGPPTINFVRRANKGIETGGRKLGVFPGSFDPLTEAHIEVIAEARKYKLGEILLVLDIVNIDKSTFGTSLEDRLLMLLLFFASDEGISVALSSHGLFLDKVRALQGRYPPATGIAYLVGYDTILRILDKKYYRDREAALTGLFAGSEFLVAGGSGAEEQAVADLFEREENRRFGHKIKTIKLTPFASTISATEVRQRVKKGEPIAGLVPAATARLIEQLQLYKEI